MSTKIGQTAPPRRGPNLDLRRAILDRIRRDKSILVWAPNDFLDLGPRSAVDKTLQRLALSGDLRRIDRGLYDLPRVNTLTGKTSTPNYNAIIDAVTRREKARFLPDGMTAVNQLGLTDAVPAKVTVHTDARPPDPSRQTRHRFQADRSQSALLGRATGDAHRSDPPLAPRYASN